MNMVNNIKNFFRRMIGVMIGLAIGQIIAHYALEQTITESIKCYFFMDVGVIAAYLVLVDDK